MYCYCNVCMYVCVRLLNSFCNTVTLINDELSGNRFTSLLPEGEEFLAETKVMQKCINFLCMYVSMYVCMYVALY
jgi:hypothetical protein